MKRVLRLGPVLLVGLGACANRNVSGDVDGVETELTGGYAVISEEELELGLAAAPLACGELRDGAIYSVGLPPATGTYELKVLPPDAIVFSTYDDNGDALVFAEGTVDIRSIGDTVVGELSIAGYGELDGHFEVPVCTE